MMSNRVAVLIVVALVAGGAGVALWSSGEGGSSTAPSTATDSVPEAIAPEVGAGTASPMPTAMATGAAEPCETPAKVEVEAAPIAKFLEAPCSSGDEGTTGPASGPGPSAAPAVPSTGAHR